MNNSGKIDQPKVPLETQHELRSFASTDQKTGDVAKTEFQKMAHTWEFVQEKGEGRYYEYRKNPKETHKKSFPATEPTYNRRLFSDYHDRKFLEKLGYKFEKNGEHYHFTFPSISQLNENLKKLHEEENYPPIKIGTINFDEDGDESKKFIEIFLQYDVIASERDDALHDHSEHLIPQLYYLNVTRLRNPGSDGSIWKKEMQDQKDYIRKYKEIVDKADLPEEKKAILYSSIAVVVDHSTASLDGFASYKKDVIHVKDNDDIFSSFSYAIIINKEDWLEYMKNQHPSLKKLSDAQVLNNIKALWEQVL